MFIYNVSRIALQYHFVVVIIKYATLKCWHSFAHGVVELFVQVDLGLRDHLYIGHSTNNLHVSLVTRIDTFLNDKTFIKLRLTFNYMFTLVFNFVFVVRKLYPL